MRHRELITPLPTLYGTWREVVDATNVVITDLEKSYTPSVSIVMDDVVTPNFRKIVRSGGIVNSPMEKTKTTLARDATSGSYRLNPNDPHTISGTRWDIMPGVLPSSFDDDGIANMKSLAVTRAWANVSGSEASAIVTVAEGKKTVDDLVNMMRRLRKIIKMVRRLQIRKLAGELRPAELADRWLEVRYGLRPLIFDARDILNAVKAEKLIEGSRQSFRGYEEDFLTETDTIEYPFGSTMKYSWARKTQTSVRVRAGVLCELSGLYNQADAWGIFDIPQAVLDLTTFSFVAGWFFNLADTVASWTPSCTWRALASWVITEKVTTSEAVQGGLTWSGNGYISGVMAGGRNYQEVVETVREVEPTRSIIPRWNLNLDVSKLIDLVAIARLDFTAIRRLRRF